jgi:hypothetical protein
MAVLLLRYITRGENIAEGVQDFGAKAGDSAR